MDKQLDCGSTLIERFLAGELSDTEQHAFERHLDSCDGCRTELHNQAAEEELWRDAQEYLSCIAASAPASPNRAAVDESLRFLRPTDDPRMLGRLGGYEISGVIGRGGMGVVLKGFDVSLNRYAAIKVLAPQLATSGAARERFAREARAAAAVVHENVMPIFSVNETDKVPYLVMPYVRGDTLQRRLDNEGALSPKEILRIAMQIASGLGAAHDQGLVHRDIKPANVMLSDGVERVMITDFGLARSVDDLSLTRTGVVAGTPQYMSPEQARGETVDHRSDLFSLGAVMYTMCTGRPPFRADSSYAILRDISDAQPTSIRDLNPEIPIWLCGIVEKLIAKSPRGRFQHAAELSQLLEETLAHLQNPNTALPDDVRRLVRERGRLRGRQALLFVGSVVVTIALLSFSIVTPPTQDSMTERKTTSQHSSSLVPTTTKQSGDVLDWNDEWLDALFESSTEIEMDSRRAFDDARRN